MKNKNFSIIKVFNNLRNYLKAINAKDSYTPAYRVSEIIQNEEEQYIIKVQIIQTNVYFNAYPEDILAKDDLVDRFSPKDIRTLTYLGYLDINEPKYKILAKRLSEKDDKLFFALKKKGDKNIIIKSANEIVNEENIVSALGPHDAQIVGYTLAQESLVLEKAQKNQLTITADSCIEA